MIVNADKAREQYYGNHLDEYNLFMPIGHLMPIIQQETNNTTHYRGLHINQHPCDAWVYQEIIHDTQPNVIISIGTGRGGSTLWLRDLLFNCSENPTRILAIDLFNKRSSHKEFSHVTFFTGDSEDEQIIRAVKDYESSGRIMVIDDCAHTKKNVLSNLLNYGPMVTKDCYYIVEDTIIQQGVNFEKRFQGDDNPTGAINEYMKTHDDFEIDRSREKFFITACPRGFLRKVK